jgi:RNA polymerase sigma factor (sigma-70 family)
MAGDGARRSVIETKSLNRTRDHAQGIVTSRAGRHTSLRQDLRGHARPLKPLEARAPRRTFRGPIGEVISEGNVGLMQAVRRFEPDKGFKLATYAMWWIRASIQEYILRSWSLVKMGTTASQKKLFFNLRKAKSRISALD